ncbi:DUF7033 domain-containing protein [Puia dinghuensis]|uniref:DUF7033 domain-containing protein n=1 Tax=Puia dinghuensis TaxID=1792502 RepID=A0A8J2UGN9_9BACT|nr:hypothetical protein [Puia dinghuensis]GGB13444.1 hypothetical protein GCM10011511_41410 [Puia dinghuensis]
MILFCTHSTPRLKYIVDFCSKELFDSPFHITTDLSEFVAATGPRINYSSTPIPGAFHLQPAGLLFETGIVPQSITCFEYDGRKAFFATEGDLPFDIFSAAFYLLTRYEEYLPHEKDTYGRYAHTDSLAWREHFLDIPLVNYWLRDFRDALARKFPALVFRYPMFKFVPTYDIDIAWSFLFKGWRRNTSGALKALVTGRWQQLRLRLDVLAGRRPDPFDAYEWLDSLHLYCRLKPYYFFLVAARNKGVDKNILPSSTGFQQLVQYHGAGYRVGVHPSWQSGDDDSLLKEEIEWLEYIAGQPICRSRQHYIRFSLPHTYRRLLNLRIEQEFSMGYGSINGFRASVASSFFWYDLEKEETTKLRVFPFCFMDANAFYEQGLNAAGAMQELMHYYRHIRKVNGLMVTIWHNNFLGTDPGFAGWREVYEVFLKEEIFWTS